MKPHVYLDWYEEKAIVSWSNSEKMQELLNAKEQSRTEKRPVEVRVGGRDVQVAARSTGKGRQPRMELALHWGKDVTIVLSARNATSRKNANFKFEATGAAFLRHGEREVMQFKKRILRELCGKMEDSWVGRIDICIDVAGLSFGEFSDAFEKKQYVSRSGGSDHRKSGRNKRTTGITFSSSRGLQLRIYDKLVESSQRKDAETFQLLVQNRWDGSVPKAATRVELQIRHEWLRERMRNTAPDVLRSLGTIVEEVLCGRKPFVRFTETEPDRSNGHQSRAKTLPKWQKIVDSFRLGLDDRSETLKPIDRSEVDVSHHIQSYIGGISKLAAIKGHRLLYWIDVDRFLKRNSKIEDWVRHWKKHRLTRGLNCEAVLDDSPEQM